VKGKKIDVFRGLKKIASIGAIGYTDYASMIEVAKTKEERAEARRRRRLYRQRHRKNAMKVGSPAYWAMMILW
jgi:hypothetical protein